MMSKDDNTKDSQSSLNKTTKLTILIISGRSGSGKSSTAYEICHLLRDQRIPHAHIDGDNLDAIYPREESSEIMLTNLKIIWTTYWTIFADTRRKNNHKSSFVVILSGTGMVLNLGSIVEVFTNVVKEGSDTREVPVTLNIQVRPTVLETSDEIAERRLRSREIGGELDEHLNSSIKMNRTLAQVQNDEIVRFTNNGTSITKLALDVLEHAGLHVPP